MAWANDELRPIGQPRAVGKVMVGIVSVPDRKLLLVGLDPATGHQIWQQPITPSGVSAGVRVGFEPMENDKVAYFRPTSVDGGDAQLVLADAATGADVAKTSEASFTSMPYPCGNGKDVCATSRHFLDASAVVHRIETATRRAVVESDQVPPGARAISDGGLFDLGDRPGNTLALFRDGEIRWRTPAAVAFPPGFTTDLGWSWKLFSREKVFVGSVGGPVVFDGPTRVIRDLTIASATAGLSEADGRVIWRDDGSSFRCHMATGDHPVRCRSRGAVVAEEGVVTSFQGIDVTVEGFDVKTGATTWSIPVGAETSLVGGDARPATAGATKVVLDTPDGPIVLDFATGRVSPPAPGATFWCLTDQRYEFSRGFRTRSGSMSYLRPGGALAGVCDARFRPALAIPSDAATLAVGARVGDYVVIAVKDAFVQRYMGLRLSPGAGSTPP